MKKIGLHTHACIDYLAAILLVAVPLLPAHTTESAQTWVPVGVGLIAFSYNLMTDYRLSIFRIVGVPTHIVFDMTLGLLLAVSPWLFGFAASTWLPHLSTGIFLFIIAMITNLRPAVRLTHTKRRKIHKPIYRTFSIR